MRHGSLKNRMLGLSLIGTLVLTASVNAQNRNPAAVPRNPSTSSATGPARTPPRSTTPTDQAVQTPRLAQLPTQPRVGMPPGFPLDADQQSRVDAILRYWEHHTSAIKTFQCKFVRQNFDFVFGPKDAAATVDRGTIRYAAPDKGLMKADEVFKFNPEAKGQNDQFVKQEVEFGEYWVCDGQSVFQFDSRTKVLTETVLPPDVQGTSIGDGPLPFLFGAKADQMKARYWIRELPNAAKSDGEYWLEATPKHPDDAANFNRLWVQLQKSPTGNEQLMPKAMKVFNKQGHVIYHFSDYDANDPRHRLAGFFGSFVRPATPSGWKKVVENWEEPAPQQQPLTAESPGQTPRLGTRTPPAGTR